jgi:hypothetical protein
MPNQLHRSLKYLKNMKNMICCILSKLSYFRKVKNKKVILSLLLLVLGLTAQAQQATTASGGDANGSGGSAAYSVGQIVYTTNTGTTGSVAQGVQQPYEIYVELGIENSSIALELSAYPNPTIHSLTLNVGNTFSENLHFELCDLNGKIIERRKINSSTETINMESLATATYFLKVSNAKNQIKIFKIIKN